MARVRLVDRNGVSVELDENHPAAARLSKPKPTRSRAKAGKADADSKSDDE